MNQRIPCEHTIQAAVDQVEGTKQGDPKRYIRETDAGARYEPRNEVNAGDVEAPPVQIVRPMPWTAARVDDRPANLLSPLFHAAPVQPMHVRYGTKNTRVLRRTHRVGLENRRISHAISSGMSKPCSRLHSEVRFCGRLRPDGAV